MWPSSVSELRSAPVRSTLATVRSGDLRPAVYLLTLTTFALLPFQGLRIGTSITYSDVALVAATVVSVLSPHRRYPAEDWPGRLLGAGLALMLVGGLVALGFSDDPGASAGLLVRLAGVVVISFALIRSWDPPVGQVRGLLGASVASSTASAVAGILAAGTELTAFDRYENSVGRGIGFAGNANLYGVVTVIGIGLAVVLAAESSDRGWRFGCAAASVLQFVGILYSGSRGAVIGAAVVFVVVAVRLVRRGQWRVVAALLGAIVVVTVAGLLSVARVPAVDRFVLRDDGGGASEESAILRLEQIPKRLDQRGYHSLTVGSGLRDTGFHNTYLDFWAGLGVVGGAGWVMVCVASVAPAVRLTRRRDRLSERDVLLFALGAAFLGFAVTALTLDNTWNRYVWLLVALVPHLRRASPVRPVTARARRHQTTDRGRPGHRRIGLRLFRRRARRMGHVRRRGLGCRCRFCRPLGTMARLAVRARVAPVAARCRPHGWGRPPRAGVQPPPRHERVASLPGRSGSHAVVRPHRVVGANGQRDPATAGGVRVRRHGVGELRCARGHHRSRSARGRSERDRSSDWVRGERQPPRSRRVGADLLGDGGTGKPSRPILTEPDRPGRHPRGQRRVPRLSGGRVRR